MLEGPVAHGCRERLALVPVVVRVLASGDASQCVVARATVRRRLAGQQELDTLGDSPRSALNAEEQWREICRIASLEFVPVLLPCCEESAEGPGPSRTAILRQVSLARAVTHGLKAVPTPPRPVEELPVVPHDRAPHPR